LKIETTSPRRPRCWVVFDLESAFLDDTAHKRYQAMERWAPAEGRPSRRGYKRADDPLRTPRWPFQTITTAAIMVLVKHVDGNIDVSRFVTLSAPEHDEREVIAGVLQVLEEAPAGAEIVSWGGKMHDCPLLVAACMRYGLTLPSDWKWLSFCGSNASRHLDLAREITGGFKMKPVHMAEVLAAMDIPAKMSAPAFAVARLIEAGQWDIVQEACEGDVISTALLLAHWRRLRDPRIDVGVVEDRILRRVIELRAGRGYVPALAARRDARFRAKVREATNDADALAPWLDVRAA
jgi:hypothetical protein